MGKSQASSISQPGMLQGTKYEQIAIQAPAKACYRDVMLN